MLQRSLTTASHPWMRIGEEEHRSHIIDVQIESALPFSPLLLGVQSFLDSHLQGWRKKDHIYNLSEFLAAFKLSQ